MAEKKPTGKAGEMTYESVRLPNLRYQLQADAHAKNIAEAEKAPANAKQEK